MTRLELERAPERLLVAARRQLVRLGGHQPVEEVRHLGRRERARELGGHAAVAERLDGRDALDAEGGLEPRVRVDVDLRELDPARPLGHGALEHRGELPARAAPLGPEVDHHRQLA